LAHFLIFLGKIMAKKEEVEAQYTENQSAEQNQAPHHVFRKES
jgi:hypothetical protein